MRLQTCQLARDFDFAGGPDLGILDSDSREVVGTACDEATRALFIAAPDLLAALRLCVIRDKSLEHNVTVMSAIAAAEGRS